MAVRPVLAAPRPPAARRWRAGAVAGLAALLLSGCATLPSGGPVQRGQAAAASGQGYLLQPDIQPPGRNWSATEMVSGFLNAMASLAGGYAAARQYLNSRAQRSWERPPGPGVEVIAPQVAVNQVPNGPPQLGPAANTQATVLVTGLQLAHVTGDGQYVASQSQVPYRWLAQLQQNNGQWQITNPPKTPPLYAPDFSRLYLSRDLYFLAPGGQALVPDPVFVPLQATSVDLARSLVTSLEANLPGWLAGAATSALAGSRLLGRVTINAGAATVNLAMPAARAKLPVLRQIMAQLIWTLASSSFGQSALVQSVELEINGRPWRSASWSGGQPQLDGQALLSVPEPPAHEPLYSVAGGDEVQEMAVPFLSATRIPLLVDGGPMPLGPIAVSPGRQYVASIIRSGRSVAYGTLKPGARLAEWSPPGGVTSVSWDARGDLWVAGARQIWMIPPGGRPAPLGGLPPRSVVQLQVAPDGVRVAMIVAGPDGNHLLLGAITHPGPGEAALGRTVSIGADVSDPTQLTWYDPDNLIVVSRPPSGPALEEVPVNGGHSTPLVSDGGTQSISAAGPVSVNPLVAALPGGKLALTYTINGTWIARTGAGLYPTYPATP